MTTHDPFGLDDEERWLSLAREAQERPELGTLGPHRLLREVGRGGQAVVYEAIREGTGARVAVKRLLAGSFADAAALRRFEREIEAVSTLSHPNIVRAEEVALHDGPLVLAMEWIDGVRVTEWANGRSRDDVLALLRKIADAVAHAHRCGFLHRDLKPANILVSADDEPHLLDFGITRGFGDGAASVTHTSHFLGTPAYCSPEQVTGEGSVDARTDVYSFGVIAYELLCGQSPVPSGGGLRRVLEAIVTAEPPRPRDLVPDLPRDLEAILLKTLAKDRERRYASMDLVLAELDRFGRGDPIEAESLGRGYRVRKFMRRHRLGVSVASAAALLVVGFAVTMAVLYRRAGLEERRLAQVESFLAAMLVPEGATSGAHALTVEEILGAASRRLEAEPFEDPHVAARLHLRLARNYGSLWKWEDDARHAEKALALARELGDDEMTVSALANLGLARTFLEDPRAVDTVAEALARVSARDGEGSATAASLMGGLAFAYVRAADPPQLARAEELYDRALAVLEAQAEPGPLLAGTRYSYAVLALEQGHPEIAVVRLEKALAVYDALPRSLSVTGARCREDYAKVLASLGRSDEAHAALARSREGRALGAEMCRTPVHVAENLARSGNAAGTPPLLLEALSLTCDCLAARRPERAAAFAELSRTIAAGRLDAAPLLAVGEAAAIDPVLRDAWEGALRGLAEAWDGSDPDRAGVCRAALRAAGATEAPAS